MTKPAPPPPPEPGDRGMHADDANRRMDPSTTGPASPAPRTPPAATARERVGLRTRELARLAGRLPPDVSQTDYEQAKQEVTGESAPARQNAILDAVAQTARSPRPSRP